MAKLQDMFKQARRAQSGGGIGFLGKNRSETKPRAAALIVKLTSFNSGDAEAALKAGADGLLFTWNGRDKAQLDAVKKEVEAVRTSNDNLVTGLAITNGWDTLDREKLVQLKDQGIQYVVLPMSAPARLIAIESKDIELVVTVPMRSGDMYPLFIRNLTAFDGLAGAYLDFGLTGEVSAMTVEDILRYRAVREAVRIPALLDVQGGISEADGYTLMAIDVQATVLTVDRVDESARQQIKALREVLEKIHQEEKEGVSRPTPR